MAYIGNTAQNQAFTPRVDYFSGNGSTTAFTLSQENKLPIIVFDMNKEGNLLKICKGETIGTVVNI